MSNERTSTELDYLIPKLVAKVIRRDKERDSCHKTWGYYGAYEEEQVKEVHLAVENAIRQIVREELEKILNIKK